MPCQGKDPASVTPRPQGHEQHCTSLHRPLSSRSASATSSATAERLFRHRGRSRAMANKAAGATHRSGDHHGRRRAPTPAKVRARGGSPSLAAASMRSTILETADHYPQYGAPAAVRRVVSAHNTVSFRDQQDHRPRLPRPCRPPTFVCAHRGPLAQSSAIDSPAPTPGQRGGCANVQQRPGYGRHPDHRQLEVQPRVAVEAIPAPPEASCASPCAGARRSTGRLVLLRLARGTLNGCERSDYPRSGRQLGRWAVRPWCSSSSRV